MKNLVRIIGVLISIYCFKPSIIGQTVEFDIENPAEIGLKVSGGTNAILVTGNNTAGVTVNGSLFWGGQFSTSNSSTTAALIARQNNNTFAPIVLDRYPDVLLGGSRMIASTSDFNIVLNQQELLDNQSFKIFTAKDDEDELFELKENGDGSFKGKINAYGTMELRGSSINVGVCCGWQSTLNLNSNRHVAVHLDKDGGDDAEFVIYDTHTNPLFSVNELGTISCSGGTITCTSDRNQKENILEVDELNILEKVIDLPTYSWNYKTNETPHLGPMAQDFYTAFKLGEEETSIATVDADGIALTAIKGLNKKLDTELRQRDELIDKLIQRIEKLEEKLR